MVGDTLDMPLLGCALLNRPTSAVVWPQKVKSFTSQTVLSTSQEQKVEVHIEF
jgi:hypothetical protein